MNSLEHQKEVERTKGSIKININESNEDLLHAALGCATEAGELVDQVKKHLFYGRQLDVVNLQEEVGDILWYLNLLCAWMGITLEEMMERNAEKLRVRYPEGFTKTRALERDIDSELRTYTACPVCKQVNCICNPE